MPLQVEERALSAQQPPGPAPIRLLQAPRPTPVRAQNTAPSLPKLQLRPQLPQPASLASSRQGRWDPAPDPHLSLHLRGAHPPIPEPSGSPQGSMCPPQVGLRVLAPSDLGLGGAWEGRSLRQDVRHPQPQLQRARGSHPDPEQGRRGGPSIGTAHPRATQARDG